MLTALILGFVGKKLLKKFIVHLAKERGIEVKGSTISDILSALQGDPEGLRLFRIFLRKNKKHDLEKKIAAEVGDYDGSSDYGDYDGSSDYDSSDDSD